MHVALLVEHRFLEPEVSVQTSLFTKIRSNHTNHTLKSLVGDPTGMGRGLWCCTLLEEMLRAGDKEMLRAGDKEEMLIKASKVTTSSDGTCIC